MKPKQWINCKTTSNKSYVFSVFTLDLFSPDNIYIRRIRKKERKKDRKTERKKERKKERKRYRELL